MSKKSEREARAAKAAALLAEQRRREKRRNLLTVGAVVLVIAVLIGGGFLYNSLRDTTGDQAVVPDNLSGAYTVTIGEDSAPTKITLYEDLQCPVCAALESSAGSLIQQGIDDGKLQVSYHMIAFLDGSSSTRYSTRALNALMTVLSTAGPEAYLKYHSLLYAEQPEEGTAGLTDDRLVQLAVKAGAEESRVKGPIQDLKYEQWVKNSTDDFSRKGFSSTPTGVIGGQTLVGAGDILSALQAAVS
jgi:protein-disulfide isomerase